MGICRREFGAGLLAAMAGPLFALPPRPKLFVLLLLDQFRPDYLEATGFPLAAGGFRRLQDKGVYFPDCRHLASTFSASSVATLATGAWPAQHGIVADRWYDRSIRNLVTASDEAMLATTLAAQVLSDNRYKSSVTVVSHDQLSGGLLAGGSDARQYWMDDSGQFATLGDPVDWLAAFNAQHALTEYHNQKWTALNAPTNAPPLRTLTWTPARPKEFLSLYRSSPFALSTLFDLVGEVIVRDKLGQGNSLDFLCILTGSSGWLGYETGARSALMQQMTLQIDHQLDSLLNLLVKIFGEKGFNFVLSAGHGAPPEPPTEYRDRMAVKGEALAQAVARNLVHAGLGSVEKYLYPFLYLDTNGFRDPEPLRMAAARAALEMPAVANYYTAGGACSARDEFLRRFHNSFHPTRSGDVMISYQPEYVEDFGLGRGVSYGSVYSYDVRVPLFCYGAQFKSGTLVETPVQSVDIAPTLARLMGVPMPSSSAGRVLGEAFA